MSTLHTAARFLGREAVRSSRGTGLFAVAVVLVLALAMVSEVPQARGPRSAATGALTPAMQAATSVDGALNAAASWFAGNRRAVQEDQQLQEENRRLAAQLAQLQATERQNAQLRAELGLRQEEQLLTTGATVVARDPDGLDRTLTIDHGSRSGVRPGMAVIAGGALVGLVRSVTGSSAQVETTADPGFTVAVVTADTGLTGIARGGTPTLSAQLTTTGETEPQSGEGVVTASGGGVPAGLALGSLTTVSAGGQAAPAVAAGEVIPFSDPAQAADVLIVRAVRS
jgi:rod shape-determining protein MreC